jgi:hypothetical protein
MFRVSARLNVSIPIGIPSSRNLKPASLKLPSEILVLVFEIVVDQQAEIRIEVGVMLRHQVQHFVGQPVAVFD